MPKNEFKYSIKYEISNKIIEIKDGEYTLIQEKGLLKIQEFVGIKKATYLLKLLLVIVEMSKECGIVYMLLFTILTLIE